MDKTIFNNSIISAMETISKYCESKQNCSECGINRICGKCFRHAPSTFINITTETDKEINSELDTMVSK